MCVDTQNYKCCCGCMTLTQATIVIGVLYLIGTISEAIMGQWAAFVWYLIMTLLFGMVIAKPYDASIRKLIYYISLILDILGAIGLVIFIIIAFAGDWEQDWCRTYYYDYKGDFYDSYSECVDWINMILIIFVVLVIVIFVPCTLCILQILYYGWKEQENVNT